MGKLIELGRCFKPHGIKGGFHFVLENAQESILSAGVKITIFPFDPSSSVDIAGAAQAIKTISFGNKVICYLEGITDRNMVEAMIPFLIQADSDLFPKLEDDEYYLKDIIGTKVFDNTSGDEIGVVTGTSDNGMQTILIIESADEEISVPWVDAFVPEVNIEQGFIKINKPEFVD